MVCQILRVSESEWMKCVSEWKYVSDNKVTKITNLHFSFNKKSYWGDCVQPLPPALSESDYAMDIILEPESA